MHKDESGAREYAKHTRNTKYGKVGINRRIRRRIKSHLIKNSPNPEASNTPTRT